MRSLTSFTMGLRFTSHSKQNATQAKDNVSGWSTPRGHAETAPAEQNPVIAAAFHPTHTSAPCCGHEQVHSHDRHSRARTHHQVHHSKPDLQRLCYCMAPLATKRPTTANGHSINEGSACSARQCAGLRARRKLTSVHTQLYIFGVKPTATNTTAQRPR